MCRNDLNRKTGLLEKTNCGSVSTYDVEKHKRRLFPPHNMEILNSPVYKSSASAEPIRSQGAEKPWADHRHDRIPVTLSHLQSWSCPTCDSLTWCCHHQVYWAVPAAILGCVGPGPRVRHAWRLTAAQPREGHVCHANKQTPLNCWQAWFRCW